MRSDDNSLAEFPVESAGREMHLGEFIGVLQRGKWIVFGVVFGALLLAYLVTETMTPIYEATATVLINSKGSKVISPFAEFGESSSKIANELGILKTRALAEGAARMLLTEAMADPGDLVPLPILRDTIENPGSGFASASTVASRVRTSMSFVPERESDLIRIVATSSEPHEAAVLANTYADVYRDYIMEASRSRSKAVREFLERRMEEQRESLARAENTVKGFMESSGIVSLDAESNQLVQELSGLEASRNALDIDIETYSRRLASIQAELPKQEAIITGSISQANDPYIRQMQEQLARLEVQRDVIVAQNDVTVLSQPLYKEKLLAVESQISALRERLRQRSGELIQSILSEDGTSVSADPVGGLNNLKKELLEVRFQLESFKAKRETLSAIISQYETRFRALPRQSIEFARIQRDRISSEKLFAMVEERFNEAAITEKSEFGYVDIVDPAVISSTPVSPNLLRNLLVGFLLGIAIAVGVVYTFNKVDYRIRTPEQLRRSGYACLVEVYRMDHEFRRTGAKVPPSEAKRFGRNVWLIFNPLSFFGESYRRLRTNLLNYQMSRPLGTLVVSSANPAEGKSTLVCNLAIALAEAEKRVLIIDADLRRPTIHTTFGLGFKPGLTDVLQSRNSIGQCLQRDVISGLDVLPCGSLVRNPGRILASKEIAQLISELRPEYDFVLIDAPPILVVNDSAALASLADGTILSVAAGGTRLEALNRSADYIAASGGKLVGLVLNMFDPRRAYGSYYGSYRYGHYGPGYGHYVPEQERS